MKIFVETPVPALYQLSAPTTDALIINVYAPAFERVEEVLGKPPPTVSFAKDRSDLVIEPSNPQDWGVAGIINPAVDLKRNWTAVRCPLEVFADKKAYTHEIGYQVSFCLSRFFTLLEARSRSSSEDLGDERISQLIAFPRLAQGVGMGQCGLSCYLLPAFNAWLLRHSGQSFPEIGKKMAKTFGYSARGAGGFDQIGALIGKDGRPFIACPGNACDFAVYPDHWDEAGKMPWEMGCHNVDTPHQQLCLLYGLACLLDLARADGH